MKCKKCGEKLEKGTTLCPKCENIVNPKTTKIPTIVIIIVGVIILTVSIGVIISTIFGLKDHGYENKLELVSPKYLMMHEAVLEPNTTSYITLEDIKNAKLVLEEDYEKCTGYVAVSVKEVDGIVLPNEYNAYVKCGFYKTKGYKAKYSKKTDLKLYKEDKNNSVKEVKEDKKEEEKDEYVTTIPYDETKYEENKIVAKYEAKDLLADNTELKCDELNGCNNSASISIILYEDNYMELSAGTGMAQYEHSRGIYEIKDNKLIYKREYNSTIIIPDGVIWDRMKKNDEETVIFIISNNTINTNSYKMYDTYTYDCLNTYLKPGFTLNR